MFDGIRTAARKKLGKPPRLIIETLVVRGIAGRVKRSFPQIVRLHLVGSRLRHRYARDIEFVAVVGNLEEMPGRTLVNVFGRPSDKEVARMPSARVRSLLPKVDLFFALPEEVEIALLEYGLGLDNIRWKKRARAKGMKLTRYGLYKGSILVTRKMAEIAQLLGLPLKPHLALSLANPF